MIVLSRFCVLERVRHHHAGWRVQVTDLSRELGPAPHHRLALEWNTAEAHTTDRVIRAVQAGATEVTALQGWSTSAGGLLLLTGDSDCPVITRPCPKALFPKVALALAEHLERVHIAGVAGIDFSHSELRSCGTHVTIVGNDWLVEEGSADQDLSRLLDLLHHLSPEHTRLPLSPAPSSVHELVVRLMRAITLKPDGSRKSPLPPTPPFVGRRPLLDRVVAEVAGDTRAVFVVRGEAGAGKSRVLELLARELTRWNEALVLTASCARGGEGPIVRALTELQRRIDDDFDVPDVELPTLLPDEDDAEGLAAELIDLASQHAPLVLLLDDAQLIDPITAAALLLLGELPDAPQVHVVLASTDPVPDALTGLQATYLKLGPLTPAEVGELLTTSLQGEIASRDETAHLLHADTCGLPGCVWVTLRQWTRDGRLSRLSAHAPWQLEKASQPSFIELPTLDAPVDDRQFEVHQVLKSLRDAAGELLPANVSLKVHVAEDSCATCMAIQLEMLAADLVIAGRDALGEEGSLRLDVEPVTLDLDDTNADTDSWLRIGLQISPVEGGEVVVELEACQSQTSELGGFIDIFMLNENTQVVSVYLPLSTSQAVGPESHPGVEVLVVHPDDRVRLTMESALANLGVNVEGLHPDVGYAIALQHEGLTIADPLTVADLATLGHDSPLVTVLRHRDAVQLDEPSLRFPFTLNALEKALSSAGHPLRSAG